MKPEQLKTMLIALIIAACIFLAKFIYEKIYAHMKTRAKKEFMVEMAAAEAEAEFYAVNANMQQHLKDDGIIKPRPGSEADFQRWKAERQNQEP